MWSCNCPRAYKNKKKEQVKEEESNKSNAGLLASNTDEPIFSQTKDELHVSETMSNPSETNIDSQQVANAAKKKQFITNGDTQARKKDQIAPPKHSERQNCDAREIQYYQRPRSSSDPFRNCDAEGQERKRSQTISSNRAIQKAAKSSSMRPYSADRSKLKSDVSNITPRTVTPRSTIDSTTGATDDVKIGYFFDLKTNADPLTVAEYREIINQTGQIPTFERQKQVKAGQRPRAAVAALTFHSIYTQWANQAGIENEDWETHQLAKYLEKQRENMG